MSKHRPCAGSPSGSLTAGLHHRHCLSLWKLICLSRSAEERIKTDKYPEESDSKEMKLSVYISGAHSDSSKGTKMFLVSLKPLLFFIWKNKGNTLKGADHQG